MNNLTVFNNKEFGSVRISMDNDKPMFCLKDVCDALGLSTPSKVKERLNKKGVNTIPTLTAGGEQLLLYIDEANLYRTIFQSRKENAEKFTDWVTSEVLPSLRKTGSYSLGNIKGLSENTQLVLAIGNSLAEQDRRINQVEKKVDDTVGDLKTIIEAIKSEANWRQGINKKIGQIGAAKKSTWEIEYTLLYRELENRARCDLAARKRNWIRRMIERGSTKTKANKTRKIDVIEDDPKLKEIFSKIVAENIITYCI